MLWGDNRSSHGLLKYIVRYSETMAHVCVYLAAIAGFYYSALDSFD